MISFSFHSGLYTLVANCEVPVPLEEAWSFFTDPYNLKILTPNGMAFQITSPGLSGKIYAGQVITYRIAPFSHVHLNWVTEITHCVHEQYFVDEQRKGPYRMWHHEHHFEAAGPTTRITDRVTYALPLGFAGRIVHGILVKPRLKAIFEYRLKAITDIFGDKPGIEKG